MFWDSSIYGNAHQQRSVLVYAERINLMEPVKSIDLDIWTPEQMEVCPKDAIPELYILGALTRVDDPEVGQQAGKSVLGTSSEGWPRPT